MRRMTYQGIARSPGSIDVSFLKMRGLLPCVRVIFSLI
jgi:hypothetical protein